MTNDEIEAMAARLEATVRAEDAKFRLDARWNKNKAEHFLVANRAGFLRLAALLLRGAITEENVFTNPSTTFQHEAAEPLFEQLKRDENLKVPEAKAPEPIWRDKLSCLGCAMLSFVVSFVFVVGMAVIFDWVRQ